MESKIIPENVLIADFMGYVHSINPNMDNWEMSGLNYHEDWNSLMLVIEKISRIPHPEPEAGEYRMDTFYPVTFGMISPNGKPMFRFSCFELFEADTLIEAAWQAVIDFIRWHNSNNKISV